jgi:hypothetical protein
LPVRLAAATPKPDFERRCQVAAKRWPRAAQATRQAILVRSAPAPAQRPPARRPPARGDRSQSGANRPRTDTGRALHKASCYRAAVRDHQPCPSNIPERGLRFACAPRSPVATGSDPLSTDLLVAGKASRPAVSQLATTHRRDQAHADEKRARGPASASDSMEPSQVRTRLSAGGSRIRTIGPAEAPRRHRDIGSRRAPFSVAASRADTSPPLENLGRLTRYLRFDPACSSGDSDEL